MNESSAGVFIVLEHRHQSVLVVFGHSGIGTLIPVRKIQIAHGHFLVDGIHGAGNAEIAQFVSALFAVKNVAEFDIPVDDVFFLTADQGIADIQTQLQGLLPAQAAGLL